MTHIREEEDYHINVNTEITNRCIRSHLLWVIDHVSIRVNKENVFRLEISVCQLVVMQNCTHNTQRSVRPVKPVIT